MSLTFKGIKLQLVRTTLYTDEKGTVIEGMSELVDYVEPARPDLTDLQNKMAELSKIVGNFNPANYVTNDALQKALVNIVSTTPTPTPIPNPVPNPVPSNKPVAPTVTGDDTTDWLEATHPLGLGVIFVSINNGSWSKYAGKGNTSNATYAKGYFKFKAVVNGVDSDVVDSPAFTSIAKK